MATRKRTVPTNHLQLLAKLVGEEVIWLQGKSVLRVVIESWSGDDRGITVNCRPIYTPGLPVQGAESFQARAAWGRLAWSKSVIVADQEHWKLIVDPSMVSRAIVAAGTADNAVCAAEAVRQLFGEDR